MRHSRKTAARQGHGDGGVQAGRVGADPGGAGRGRPDRIGARLLEVPRRTEKLEAIHGGLCCEGKERETCVRERDVGGKREEKGTRERRWRRSPAADATPAKEGGSAREAQGEVERGRRAGSSSSCMGAGKEEAAAVACSGRAGSGAAAWKSEGIGWKRGVGRARKRRRDRGWRRLRDLRGWDS